MNSSMICQFPKSKPTIPNTLCNAKNLRSRPPPKCLGVLIVDDNESRGIANAEMISRFGHAVDLAQDGISALRMAAANQPDVVLLNTDLQNLDDCDVARRLRFDYPERPPLIIGLASKTNSLTRWRCVKAGMDMVLEAPLDAEAIETVLLFECAKLTVEKNSDSSTRLQRRRVCIPAKPNTVVASHSIATNQLLLN